MKISNVLIGGLVVWAGYELYKTHNINATFNAMKADVNRLKTKVMSMQNSSEATTSGAAKAACTPTCAIVNKGVTSTCVGGNKGVWSNYVGQPIYTEIIAPNCGNALKDYTGTCYNSMFRKKATAFKHGQGFQGWGV